MQRYHTIVIGLGAMGSATAYQLSKRGIKVLGIDRSTPPHDRGSSHGETRITRQAIGEGSYYSPLVLRSHEIWRDIEEVTGDSLMTVSGGLIISRHGSGGQFHGRTNFIEQTIASAQNYDIPYQLLSSSEIRNRFPQFLLSDDEFAYFEPGAGFVRPERCIATQLRLARSLGAEIRTDESVLDFFPDGDGVKVVTSSGEYCASKLIVSAGAWVPHLLPEYSSLFRIYRQIMFWFDVDYAFNFTPGRFPIFIWDYGVSEDNGMYGFPAIDGKSTIKIAAEQYDTPTSVASINRTVSQEEVRQMFAQHAAPHIKGVIPSCVETAVCQYTVTPDSHFVLDTLPGCDQIVIASPCSGHGFKHSAAIGEILADLAVDGRTDWDISAFKLSRFENLLDKTPAKNQETATNT